MVPWSSLMVQESSDLLLPSLKVFSTVVPSSAAVLQNDNLWKSEIVPLSSKVVSSIQSDSIVPLIDSVLS